MDAFKKIQKAIASPEGYIRTLDKEKAGYFCSYVPEEILHAAGVVPVRIFPGKREITLSDEHLQSYCCFPVRSYLDQALSGAYNSLAGLIFSNTCDSIQRLSDIVRINRTMPFHYDFPVPLNLTSPSARDYMISVLLRFKKEIEGSFGVRIDDDALESSISLFSEIRRGLRRLYEIKGSSKGTISYRKLNDVVSASMIMDREEFLKSLNAIVEQVENEDGRKAEKRLMIAGGICHTPEILEIMEDERVQVVWDDLCTGTRHFEDPDTPEREPIKRIADRLLLKGICPAKHNGPEYRGHRLVSAARELKVDGVIFFVMKFCDPHAFDIPYMVERLKAENVASLVIEADAHFSAGQAETRIEAFFERL